MIRNRKNGLLLLGALFFTAASVNAQTGKEVKIAAEQPAQKKKLNEIPFTVAEAYFVNNTVKGKISNSKIETQAQFEKIFGAAAVMGKDGQPTKIDFSKQYVIVVVKPDTQLDTILVPVSLQKSGDGKIVFTYQTKMGKKQSQVSGSALLILVDKANNGNIVVNEAK
ncbi:hypothetical protein DBR28_14260 [Chryseobacterium sp. HMWF028]|nr:hypothetical protein DBR28_14260 [Chryseobacterium sp. HMWF028]